MTTPNPEPADGSYYLDPSVPYAEQSSVGFVRGVEVRGTHRYTREGGWVRLRKVAGGAVEHEPVGDGFDPLSLAPVETRATTGPVLSNPEATADGREIGKLADHDPARPDHGPGRTTLLPAADAPATALAADAPDLVVVANVPGHEAELAAAHADAQAAGLERLDAVPVVAPVEPVPVTTPRPAPGRTRRTAGSVPTTAPVDAPVERSAAAPTAPPA